MVRATVLLSLLLLPTVAVADGAQLAEKIERSERTDKNVKRWRSMVKRLSLNEQELFVAWARTKRAETPWLNLVEPLGAIGSPSAAAELGEVARGPEIELDNSATLADEALDTLTSPGLFPTDVMIGELVKGLLHPRASVLRMHRPLLLRLLRNSKGQKVTQALIAINELAAGIRTQRGEIADEIGDLQFQLSDLESPDDPAPLREELQLQRDRAKAAAGHESMLLALMSQAFSQAQDLDPFLQELVSGEASPCLAAGVAKGIALRAKRWKPEADPTQGEVEEEQEEAADEEQEPELDENGEPVVRRVPRRHVTQGKVTRTIEFDRLSPEDRYQSEQLADALLTLAQREEPDPMVQAEVFTSLLVFEGTLSAGWAEVLIDALGTRGPVETAAMKALVQLTGVKTLPASKEIWREWWKKQEDADDEE